ncbi:hypothetical protein G9A89_009842 [Geosiphon pyriformis]|nr:hypothetical protein G9A89_009842 [Geosiphon pyriformis]
MVRPEISSPYDLGLSDPITTIPNQDSSPTSGQETCESLLSIPLCTTCQRILYSPYINETLKSCFAANLFNPNVNLIQLSRNLEQFCAQPCEENVVHEFLNKVQNDCRDELKGLNMTIIIGKENQLKDDGVLLYFNALYSTLPQRFSYCSKNSSGVSNYISSLNQFGDAYIKLSPPDTQIRILLENKDQSTNVTTKETVNSQQTLLPLPKNISCTDCFTNIVKTWVEYPNTFPFTNNMLKGFYESHIDDVKKSVSQECGVKFNVIGSNAGTTNFELDMENTSGAVRVLDINLFGIFMMTIIVLWFRLHL